MKDSLTTAAAFALLALSTAVGAEQTPASSGRATAASQVSQASGPVLRLKKGDRIVLLGNTLAERQQYFNHFETALMLRFSELELTVRNLGWSGDTVTLQPRPLNFGTVESHLTQLKTDVVFAFFGLNESFDGDAGLPAFEAALDAYLTTHLTARYNGYEPPRVVLVSPPAHERLDRLARIDVEARNAALALYTAAMRKAALRHDVPFIDLFTPTRQLMATATMPLTINGIHVNEHGDRIIADLLMRALRFGPETRDAGPRSETPAIAALRETIREKNEQFFFRFRPVNAEYVVGRRVEPFGAVNYPPELRALDELVSAADRRIWKQARSLQPQPIRRRPARLPDAASRAGQ